MRKGKQKMKIESQKMVERWVLIDCASTIFCIIWLKQHKFCSFYWSNSTAVVSEFQFFFFEGDISRVVTCLVSKISFYSSSVHGSSIFKFFNVLGQEGYLNTSFVVQRIGHTGSNGCVGPISRFTGTKRRRKET